MRATVTVTRVPDGDVLPIFIVTGVRYRVDALL